MTYEIFMTEEEVIDVTELSRSTIRRLRRANQFPRKYLFACGCQHYKASEVIAWCEVHASP